MAAKKPDATAEQQLDAGGGTAVLDPPPERLPEAMTDDGLVVSASMSVTYLADELGRLRGAVLHMAKPAPDGAESTSYEARIRWQDGAFAWLEPDDGNPGEWKPVKRGHHTQRLEPIVEQAIEYATNRVFAGGWPG